MQDRTSNEDLCVWTGFVWLVFRLFRALKLLGLLGGRGVQFVCCGRGNRLLIILLFPTREKSKPKEETDPMYEENIIHLWGTRTFFIKVTCDIDQACRSTIS